MSLKVIGAGFGRTGTLSLKQALERLGFGPCYHMLAVVSQPERIAQWSAAAEAQQPDWDGIFQGFRATVDWPAATYWRELAAHFPDAKVILSVRDPDRWFQSTQNTIFSPRLRDDMPPEFADMVERTMFSLFGGRINDRERCIEVYERHNRAVISALPPERLLVFQAADGWEPLCTFLGCEPPGEAFPHVNDATELWETADRMKKSPAGTQH